MRALLCCLCLALAACNRQDANPAAQIDQAVQQAREAEAQPALGAVDPVFEQLCKDVNRDQAKAVAERIRAQQARGELPVLVGDEMTLKACADYWQRLQRQ